MESKKNTRKQLGNALFQLMRVRSFDRITIRDIVEQCGVGRQTFYYYFQDKYDLMNWVCEEDMRPFVQRYDRQEQGDELSEGNWSSCLIDLCRHMWQEKAFYRNALKTSGPNSFPVFFRSYITRLTMGSIRQIAGRRDIDPEKFRFVVDFCTIALIGMLTEWSEHGMKEDPVVFVEKMQGILDGSTFAELYGEML